MTLFFDSCKRTRFSCLADIFEVYFESCDLPKDVIKKISSVKNIDEKKTLFLAGLEKPSPSDDYVRNAFFDEYRDDKGSYKYIECFEGYLNRVVENYDASKYFSPVTAVIQSSGMGKSRSFKEIAKNYLTFYVVFRMHDETGFPEACKALTDYLLFNDMKDRQTDFFVVFRYICFLKACIDMAHVVLPILSGGKFEKFYLAQVNEKPIHFWQPILERAKCYETDFKAPTDPNINLAKFIRNHTYSLQLLNPLISLSEKPLKVLFVLDEIHVLNSMKM